MRAKQLKNITFILTTVVASAFFNACGPVITFSETQPTGVVNLKEFPSVLKGTFINKEDSSKLFITDKMAVYSGKVTKTVLKKAVDTLDGVRYDKDKIYGLERLYKGPISYKLVGKDSLTYSVTTTDTIFKIERKNYLRNLNQAYYLNKQLYKTSWRVTQLKYDKDGNLIVGDVSERNDLPKLVQMKAVQEVKSDSGDVLMYRVHLRKGQFKKFIKNNGFSDTKEYTKIK